MTERPVTPEAGGRDIVVSRDWIWPAAIIAGLTLVVLVNLAFVWVAVGGADAVVPSYHQEAR